MDRQGVVSKSIQLGQVRRFQFHWASKRSQPGYMLVLYAEEFQIEMELASYGLH